MTFDTLIKLENRMKDIDFIQKKLCDADNFFTRIKSGGYDFMEAIKDRSISIKTIEEIVNEKI